MSRLTSNWRASGVSFGRFATALGFVAAVSVLALAPSAAFASSGTWSSTSTGTDWAATVNWNNGTIPGYTLNPYTANNTDSAIFAYNTGSLTVMPDANRYVIAVYFQNGAGSYTIGVNGGTTLRLGTGSHNLTPYMYRSGLTETIAAPIQLTRIAGSTGGTSYEFSNFAQDSTNILKVTGDITTNSGSGASPNTILVDGMNTGNNLISGNIIDPTGAISIRKYGNSSWTFSGTNNFAGNTNFGGGTLKLDFNGPNAPTNGADIFYHGLAAANTINPLEGGTLIFQGKDSTSNTQRFTQIRMGAGGQMQLNGGANGSMIVTTSSTYVDQYGSNGGPGSLDVAYNVTGASGAVAALNVTSSGNIGAINGIVASGNLANITVNGRDWAALDASNNIVAYSGYATDNYGTATSHVTVTNPDINTVNSSAPINVKTLAFRSAGMSSGTVILPSGTNTLSAGSILMGAQTSQDVIITGGAISSTNNEILIHQFNTANTLTIDSTSNIVNNGSTPLLVLKAGPGTAILTGAKTYTGNTVIGNGALQLGDGITGHNGSIATGTANKIFMTSVGQLVFNNADAQSFSNNLAVTGSGNPNGMGNVVFKGAGTVTLQAPTTAPGYFCWKFNPGSRVATDRLDASGEFGAGSGSYPNFIFDGGTLEWTGSDTTKATSYRWTQVNTGGVTYLANGNAAMDIQGGGVNYGLGTRTYTLGGSGNGLLDPVTNSPVIWDAYTATNTGVTGNLTTIVKTGTGAWTINPSNSLNSSGEVQIQQGTLKLWSNNTTEIRAAGTAIANQSPTYNISSGAYLDLGGNGVVNPGVLCLLSTRSNQGMMLKGDGTVIYGSTSVYGTVKLYATPSSPYSRLSPGSLGVGTLHTGNEIWNSNGANGYVWEVNSVSTAGGSQAAPTVGPGGTGGDLLDVHGTIDLTGLNSSNQKMMIWVNGLSGTSAGAVANWNGRTGNYTWTIAQQSSAQGWQGQPFDPSLFSINTAGFTGAGNVISGAGFSVSTDGNGQLLYLNYSGSGLVACTYSLTAGSNHARIMNGGQTATISSIIHNTGTSELADNLTYTGLSYTNTALGTGTVGNPATMPKNNSGIPAGATDSGNVTFTSGSTLGAVTFTPTVTTVIESGVTPVTNVVASASPTGTTVNVLTQRVFSTPVTVNIGNVLVNGKIALNNSMGFTTSTGDDDTRTRVTFGVTNLSGNGDGVTLTGASSTFNGSTAAGSRTLGGVFQKTAYNATYSNVYSISSTGENLTGEGSYGINFNYTANVGIATVVGAKSLSSDPTPTILSGQVAPAGVFLDLASKTLQDVSRVGDEVLGTEATLKGGHNATLSTATITMQWRTRTDAEKVEAVPIAPAGQYAAGGGLISDVMDLGNPNGDLVAVQMTYSNAELLRIWHYDDTNVAANDGGSIHMDWWNGSSWVNAGTIWKGNMAAPDGADLTAEAGWYGVNLANHVVWAVINHGGSLAAVPEPATIVMLLSGLMAMAGFAWRRKR
jgi:fibronectin-binding autotransporter adhesin